jgi:hypothetical protein
MKTPNKFKLLILIILFLLCGNAFSQIDIIIQQPPFNRLNVEDMWRVTLVSHFTTPVNVYLRQDIIESNRGKIIWAVTKPFVVNPGVNVLGSSITVEKVEYLNNELEKIIAKTGSVPSGTYDVCITVTNSETGKDIGKNCIQQEINLLTQPILLSPQKGFEVNTPLPVFNWLPPSPMKSTAGVSYTLIIVEILANQTPLDAMRSNLEWYKQSDITTPIVQYSLASRPLLNGKRYAWKVKAYISGNLVSESEIWDFKFNDIADSLKKIFLTKNPDINKYGSANENFIKNEFEINKLSADDYISLKSLNANSADLYSASEISNSKAENIFPVSSGSKIFKSNEGIPILKNVLFSGSYRITGQSANRNGTNQNTPMDFARLELNPVLSFYNIPLGLNVIATTEGDASKQNISNISFTFNSNSLIEQVKNKALTKVFGDKELQEYDELKALLENPETLKDVDLLKEMEKQKPEDPEKLKQYEELKKKVEKIEKAKERVKQLEEMKSAVEDISSTQDGYDLLDKVNKYTPVSGFTKFLAGIREFSIGTVYPAYSEFTLNGASLTGLNLEYNPGLFYFAISGLRNQKAIQISDNNLPVYERNLISTRLGIGQKDGSHFFITYQYAKDDEYSVTRDTASLITPMKNNLIGLEGKLALFDGIWSITGEIAGALLTRDILSPEINDPAIPEFVTDLFDINLSSSVDFAYTVRTDVNLPYTDSKFSADVRMVGPGFTSAGAPNLTKDRFGFGFKLDQSLFDNRVTLSGFFKTDEDNLIEWKRSTTRTTAYGITAGFSFPNLPYLFFSVLPMSQYNNVPTDTFRVDNEALVMNFSTGYSFPIGGLFTSTNINYIYQSNTTFNSVSDFISHNFLINEAVSFLFPLSLTLGYGFTANSVLNTDFRISNYNFGATYSLLEGWTVSAGIDYATESTGGDKIGLSLSTRFPVWVLGDMEITAQNNRFKNTIGGIGNFDEFILRAVFINSL